MLTAIGNTPLVRLSRIVPPGAADVWVKLEYYNPTGSYKDRMALAMVERAEQRGSLKPGMSVVEYTGGSTGISLAFVCAVKGYRCRIVCNDAVALEKRRTMEVFGAQLEVLKSDGGKLTPDLVPRMMARAREIAAEGPSYATDQMRNPDMVAGYEPLGEELLQQAHGPIHAFCAAVGTAGMLMGTGRVLRRADPKTRLVALEPATSAVLSGGTPGRHGVEGVAPGFRAAAVRPRPNQRDTGDRRDRGAADGVDAGAGGGALCRHVHRAQRRRRTATRARARRRSYRRHGGCG
jgi:cysteine synthase A